MEELQHYNLKVLATQGEDIPPAEFILVLQRWIQEHAVEGALVDVADYSHIHEGAGVILVGHEMNMSIDYGDGNMGLLYRRRQPLEGDFSARVMVGVAAIISAAHKLQEEEEFKGRLSFDASRVLFTANDSLLATSDNADGVSELNAALADVASRIYGESASVEVTETNLGTGPSFVLSGNGSDGLAALAGRCMESTAS